MHQQNHTFHFTVYEDSNELPVPLRTLLETARENTKLAYAPYSNFKVSAVAQLQNGTFVTGTNQENASYPVGICAERVLLASVASQHPDVPIETIAITYKSNDGNNDHPIAPCGMCRQTLQEYEMRMQKPVQLVLSGVTGPVYVIENGSCLLPLAFTSKELD